VAKSVDLIIKHFDDLDAANGVETILDKDTESFKFGLDGQWYEIDLSDENINAFRSFVSPYVNAARKPAKRSPGRRPASSNGNTKQIRQWAVDQGIQISPKGAIPKEVRSAFEAAQGNASKASE